MLQRCILGLSVLCLVLAGIGTASAAYTVTTADLTSYGTSQQAWSINNSGEIAGRMMSGVYKAYLWSQAGGMHWISAVPNSTGMWCFATNNNHQVTGYAQGTGTDFSVTSQAVYVGTTASSARIAPTNGQWGSGRGLGINDLGQVMGYCYHTGTDNNSYPFFYDGTNFVQLGGYKVGSGWATSNCGGINNLGQVVDTYAPVSTAAVLWNTSVSTTSYVTLPMYGSDTSATPMGINDSGQIAGYSYGNTHALLWTTSGGSPTGVYSLGDLGAGGATAYGISDSGVVAGTANYTGGGTHGFIWTPTVPNGTTGTMVDVNSLPEVIASGLTITSIRGVSHNGTILGLTATTGKYLVLTPVPEPSTLALVSTLLLGLVAYGWRKRR